MLVPARPALAVKLLIAGGTKKLELVVQVPEDERTLIGPEETAAGVSTRIKVSDCTAKLTPGIPLKAAFVAPTK